MSPRYDDFPEGLELVGDPLLAQEIRKKVRPRRRRVHPPIVVSEADFLGYDEARRIAGLRWMGTEESVEVSRLSSRVASRRLLPSAIHLAM